MQKLSFLVPSVTALASLILISCCLLLYPSWNNDATQVMDISLLDSSYDPYGNNDMWAATALGPPSNRPSSAAMLAAASTSSVSPTNSQPALSSTESSVSRGRDVAEGISARGIGHDDHNFAETFIDKHIYPPWPTMSGRARNTVDEDKITEGELAARLSRAIDRHEKCRRHWPHLERLEAAQEIRVRDARNNLEVSNRGIERARKELIDAENLVMAARQV
jgi:hypothetical protein